MSEMHFIKKNRGKVKLFKDLKHDRHHLRQSLLEKDEIQDLQKVFKSKKEEYKIPKQRITTRKQTQDEQDAYETISLTFEQKIETYKQQQVNEKIKQKISYLIGDKNRRSLKARPPVVHHLLSSFMTQFQSEEPFKLNEELKKSQQNLQHIKINSRKKVQEDKIDIIPKKRNRFISLQTGMPEKAKQYYPSFEEVVQAKYTNTDTKSYQLDVDSLEKKMNQVQYKKQKQDGYQHLLKEDKFHHEKSTPSISAKKKSNIEQNAEKTFNRSEHYSRMVIGTMSKFYHSKASKRREYDNMIQYLKHDRPLTAEIRRRNYQIIGKQQVGSVNLYRNNSEQYRRSIQKNNYNFYISLLKEVEAEAEQQIPTTVKILQLLKNKLQTQYLLTRKEVKILVAKGREQPPDILTEFVLNRIQKYAHNNPQK